MLGTAVRVLASRQDTGSYEVTLQEGPEGTGPPPHEHPWDEAFFVLDGELEFTSPGGSATKMFGELHAELDRENPDPGRAVAILERNGARLAPPPE